MVDPLIELTQPGGPFPYGESLLTDGGGNWTIAPTLRPYFLSLLIDENVFEDDWAYCEHNGLSTGDVGIVLPVPTSLIGITVVVNAPIRPNTAYRIEVFTGTFDDLRVIADLGLTEGRVALRRDLSEEIKAGVEFGARIKQTKGRVGSAFSQGRVGLELES